MSICRPEMRWVGAGVSVAVVVVWFCSLAPLGGPARRQRAEMEHFERDDGKMDWSDCGLDFLGSQFTKTFLKEDGVSDSTELDQETGLSTADEIEKTIALLPPHMRPTLLDCLSKRHFPFLVSGEEESPRNWYIDYLELLFGWLTASRRQLSGKTSQASAPISAPAPAPALALVPAPSPMVDPPTYSPAPSPIFAPASSPSFSGQSPAASPEQIFSAPPDGGSPGSLPNSALILPPKNDDSSKTLIVVVVLTATGSVFFTSFLFYCYNRFFRNKANSGDGQRDGRPLLTLSGSNFSVGSSQQSSDLKNSVSMDNIVTHPFKREPSHNGQVASFTSHNEIVSSMGTSSADAPASVVSGIAKLSDEPSTSAIPIVPPAPRPPPPPGMPPIKKSVPPPNPPFPPPNVQSGPYAPAPPKGSFAPRPPQASSSSGRRPSPLGPSNTGHTRVQETVDNAPKTKLKPFFWDKVLANPDQSMVWHQINSGSFQFNEEMIETLFGYSADQVRNVDKKKSALSDPSQYIQILDSKKSQNLAILLRALNVTTEEVCDALLEGNELPTELLQTLLKMAPTADEELRLRLYAGEISQLGPAERFLKSLIDIPFAFKRLDALLLMGSLEEDISSIKKDLAIIEAACKELKDSRLFKKLLEAVVKIGNRMNDGTYRGGAQAFKLDTLLKLADVKGTDGKTTLLHFVVQEIIRSEGVRAEREAKGSGSISTLTTTSSLRSDDCVDDSPRESRDYYRKLGLQVVLGLTSELEDVKNAALLDADTITSMVESLGEGLVKTKKFLNTDMGSIEEDSGFHHSLKSFIECAEVDVTLLIGEEKRIRLLVKCTTDFFHGNVGKDEGLRLFVIVRDFLGMLDKACKEVKQVPRGVSKTSLNRETSDSSLSTPRRLFFPPIREQHLNSSSSDDGSP